MQRPDYKSVFAISQSAIKAFATKGLTKFKKIYVDKVEDDEDDQDKYAFGSLVDTLSFQPDLIDDRFFMLEHEVTIPGDKLKLTLDRTYKEALTIIANKKELNDRGNLPEPLYIPALSDIYEWQDTIFKIAREVQFGGTTWSRTRILEKAFEEGGDYFRMLADANGRSIITGYDNADAVEMVSALRTDANTLPYFVQQENETLLFQQEIFLEVQVGDMMVPLKGALDIIRINHNDKTIQVPDLKTTYDSAGFRKIAKSFDYVTQASFYRFLVKEWIKTYHGGKYNDYTLLTPINIVIDRELKIPYIYEYDWEDVDIAEHGSEANNVKGWRNILEEIAWHLHTGIWNKPKELFETGKIKLKIFNR